VGSLEEVDEVKISSKSACQHIAVVLPNRFRDPVRFTFSSVSFVDRFTT
jgi:hypothetical protein